MYCHQCGAWVSVTDTYCAICGAETASIVDRLTGRISHTQPKKRVFICRYRRMIILSALFIGIVTAGIYYANNAYTATKLQSIGQNKPQNGSDSTSSRQIRDTLSQKLQPILHPDEAQVQELCEHAMRDLYQYVDISFSYEQESHIKELSQTQKRWRLTGFFRQGGKDGRQIKQGYICSVQLADKKQKRSKAGVAVILQ